MVTLPFHINNNIKKRVSCRRELARANKNRKERRPLIGSARFSPQSKPSSWSNSAAKFASKISLPRARELLVSSSNKPLLTCLIPDMPSA